MDSPKTDSNSEFEVVDTNVNRIDDINVNIVPISSNEIMFILSCTSTPVICLVSMNSIFGCGTGLIKKKGFKGSFIEAELAELHWRRQHQLEQNQ